MVNARKSLSAQDERLDLDGMDKEIAEEMDEAIEFAMDERLPPIGDLFAGVYEPSQPGPESVRERIARALADDRRA